MEPKKSEERKPLVMIVDSDASVRTALEELVQSVGIETCSYSTAQDVNDAELMARPGCLILDVRLPGVSGLDFQRQLVIKGKAKPIIFLTEHGDIPMTVQAMKAGAVDFLTKPVRAQTLLDAIAIGIELDTLKRAEARYAAKQASLFATLTLRERQVVQEVVRGRLNKQIAFDLGIAEATAKLHRGNAMRKMQATSVTDLMCRWDALPPEAKASDSASTSWRFQSDCQRAGPIVGRPRNAAAHCEF